MLEALILGGGFAFAAAVQPGPLQAFLLSRVAAVGWRRTLPAAVAPLISDGPIAFAMLALLDGMARGFERVLQGLGGCVLLYFAVRTLMEWRKGVVEEDAGDREGPKTLLQAVVVNLLNPGPYLGWSLILGPAVLRAWDRRPVDAVALVGSFYGTMVVCLVGFILLVGTTTRFGPSFRRRLLLLSAVALFGLAVFSWWMAFAGWGTPQPL
jgi:threonine/homoserine/homoserine lactone efflux protein